MNRLCQDVKTRPKWDQRLQIDKYITSLWYLNGYPDGDIITLGQQYNIRENPTVIHLPGMFYHHAQPPIIPQQNHCSSTYSYEDRTNNVDNSTIEPYKNRGLGKQ